MADFEKSLAQYLDASYPAFFVVTHEESRAEASIKAVAKRFNRPVLVWTVKFPDGALCVLKDVHPHIGNPRVMRAIRDALPALKSTGRPLIFLGPIAAIPLDLEKEITRLDFKLPDVEALGAVFDQVQKDVETAEGEGEAPVTPEIRRALTEAARAMTAAEAENAFSLAWATRHAFDEAAVTVVRKEKALALKKTNLVSWVESDEDATQFGGLDPLDTYIDGIAPVFHNPDGATAFGLRPEDFPRSILLMGPAGTGKSTVAKALGRRLKIALVQSHFGSMHTKDVGGSEQNAVRRNEIVETQAPCVDWWDEAEKALAGAGGQSEKNPWEARVGATLLTWMEEHRARVLIVACVNKPELLSPELTSRFQKVFFVDLPTRDGRADILKIHAELRGMKFSREELLALANETEGYSGRELRNGIQGAAQAGFAAGLQSTKEIPVAMVKAALAKITPVSRSRKDEVDRLRQWAVDNRIERANTPEGGSNGSAPVRKFGRR
jgi:ATP-dependent 26S proteasome regulatory subunit